jgi:retron-type reverse transcriptase
VNRLQKKITKLLHSNQCGFNKVKSIQDCIAWAFEYLHLCKQSKKELVALKLDFEKYFDKNEHKVIIDILRHKVFGKKCIRSIEMIIASGHPPFY